MPAGSPLPLRLPRAARLRTGRDFTRLKTRGRRLVSGCLILNWLGGSEGEARRLGVVTSRKVGEAVARNRARRLLREAYRRHQHEFPAPLDLVLVARPSIAGRSLAEVERDFQTAVRRAGLCAQNEHRPTTHHA
jgi:ribonuclease P protein component